jgi:MaoC like domain
MFTSAELTYACNLITIATSVNFSAVQKRRTEPADASDISRITQEEKLDMANPNQSGASRVLYLDDLRVGQRFISGTHLISDEAIMAFAKQFDPQPFHLDAEAAKATLFEGLVASGWLAYGSDHDAAIGGGRLACRCGASGSRRGNFLAKAHTAGRNAPRRE